MNLHEAEAYLVGFALGDDSGGRFRDVGNVRPEFFRDPAAASIWRAIRNLLDEDRPAGLLDVSSGAGLSISDLAKRMGVSVDDGLTRTAVEIVVDAWAQRKYAESLERIVAGEARASDLRAEIEAIGSALSQAGSGAIEGKILAARLDPKVEPPKLRELFCLGGTCVATPGNIVAICAAAKAGKSAFIGAAIGSTLSEHSGCDFLGLTGFNSTGGAVVHIDTEQAPADHWRVVRTALDRASVDVAPEWLLSYGTAGWSPKDRQNALPVMLRLAQAAHGHVHAVFIDGVADMVNDPNDGEECFPFVDSLQALAVKYDCPIFICLHLNPGTEKSRGHLGSQIERRAETNLVLEKDGDSGKTVVYSTKQRRAPILKSDGPCFQWDVDAGRHVSAEGGASAKETEIASELRELAEEVFGGSTLRYAEACAGIERARRVGTKAGEKWFTRMKKANTIRHRGLGVWEVTNP